MRARTVAIECGTSRSVIGAFNPAADGELMLEEYALVARPASGGTGWPDLPTGMRQTARFVVSPQPNLTLTKVIELPPVPRAQQERVVRFEAAQAIPRSLAELAWDWMPLGGDGRAVLLAATKLETAEALAAEAAAAGVRLDAIVPRAAALLRALEHNYPETTGAVVLAEIEGATALLVQRSAERVAVRLVGLPALAPVPVGGGAASEEASGDDLRLRRLIAEAMRPVGDPRGEDGDAPVLTLLLAGPDAPEAAAVERLAGAGIVRVERFDALRRVRIGPRASGAAGLGFQLGAVVGATLCVSERQRPGVNLLPPARQRENAFRRNRWRWLAAVGACALVAVAATIVLRISVARELRAEAVLKRELQPWRDAQRTVTEKRRELENCQRELAALCDLERTRTSWAVWFAATQERLARGGDLWLERVQPAVEARPAAAPFSHRSAPGGSGGLRLAIAGCALDPGSDGRRGLERVRALLHDWAADAAVAEIAEERFDTGEAGLVRFDCVLVLKPESGL